MSVKVFGGFQGMPPFRKGTVRAEFVVLDDPKSVGLFDLRQATERAINREKVTYKLDRGSGWTLGYFWSYPPKLPDEAQRMEVAIMDRSAVEVGTVTLVWPTEEAMRETA